MKLFKYLSDYYHEKGISALNFNCKHHQNCKAGYEDRFTTSKEALIGPFFGDLNVPKLLFISLDPGYSTKNPADRTLKQLSDNINDDYAKWVKNLNKNSHWWRTHEIAFAILSKHEALKNLKQEETTKFFAHINSAKCCIDNEGGRKAPSKLFKNCKEYLAGEVEIINPDIVVTQGEEAFDSIVNSFSIIEEKNIPSQRSCYDKYKVISVNNKKTLWIHTYHPTYYAIRRESKHQTECFNTYAEIALDFINNRKVGG